MYQLIETTTMSGQTVRNIKRLSDNAGARTECCAFIPFDPANTDYQEYLAWLEEGNTPLPPDEPQTQQE